MIKQGALPQIIANTDKAFFENAMNVLGEAAEICYQKLKEIECVTCPHKPEGSMFVMVKLDLSLDGIHDDVDFCTKVAREESVVICPGTRVIYRSWIQHVNCYLPCSIARFT
jgi:aspartate/methionine/tyrosine aminotransferase